jgi:transcriptional regulator with XRE-family HTH domain
MMDGTAEAGEIGGLLRHARLARGLSVQEAADLADVSPSRICQVERAETAGALQFDTLERVIDRVRGMDITEIDASKDSDDQRTVRLGALLVLEMLSGFQLRP